MTAETPHLEKTVPISYRDELNFAEFPLAALSDRLPEGVKTLVFEDTIFDQGARKPVTRTLTIAASDKYGLPTALDEEVILGLIQLTAEQKFADRKIHFTRYELIRLLGWSEKGQSYRRIDESLRRWMGVTLYYDKAWWSREDQTWVTEQFHILEQVTLLDRERRERRKTSGVDDPNAGKSSFVWNEVVWSNFKAGHLKKLDFDLFKALSTPIAKRMYRFLDKHFYHRDRLEYPLRTFACEHIGLSRGYHNGELKRKLQPALSELEARGFLKSLSTEQRFLKVTTGEWKIVLQKAERKLSASNAKSDLSNAQEVAKAALIARGVGEKKATELARRFAPEAIEEKIALHDYLKRKDDKRMAKPTGFLIKAIEDAYDINAYPDYLKQRAQATISKGEPQKMAGTQQGQERKADVDPEESEQTEFECYWSTLSESEQQAFEKEALVKAEIFLATQYRREETHAGTLFRTVRQRILWDHFRRTVPT